VNEFLRRTRANAFKSDLSAVQVAVLAQLALNAFQRFQFFCSGANAYGFESHKTQSKYGVMQNEIASERFMNSELIN
jgi:hypothetical protein